MEQYIAARKAERGLAEQGERWIRQNLPRFEAFAGSKGKSLLDVDRDLVREYLGSLARGPWNRHSHFRAVRAFYNWAEREGHIELSPKFRPAERRKQIRNRCGQIHCKTQFSDYMGFGALCGLDHFVARTPRLSSLFLPTLCMLSRYVLASKPPGTLA